MTGAGSPLTVVVTGGSGASGTAVARALQKAGHRVFTVGSDQARIEAAAAEAGGGVTPLTCDLAAPDAVRRLRDDVAAAAGPVDAVIHLVGGWRGGQGITDQSDEDWDFLHRSAITTLRNVSRAFYDDIAASRSGRFAIVSSASLDTPAAGMANYVAAKAAAEAWTTAMADGFRTASGGDAAAVVFVVKALVDDSMRRSNPGRSFAGATDVEDLAAAVVDLFTRPGSERNGNRLRLAD